MVYNAWTDSLAEADLNEGDSNMERVEVTWKKTVIVWWSYVWRCTVFGAILGFVLGFIGGLVASMLGQGEASAMVGFVLGYLGGIPVSIYVMKKILEKQYAGWSVALVSDVQEDQEVLV